MSDASAKAWTTASRTSKVTVTLGSAISQKAYPNWEKNRSPNSPKMFLRVSYAPDALAFDFRPCPQAGPFLDRISRDSLTILEIEPGYYFETQYRFAERLVRLLVPFLLTPSLYCISCEVLM